MQVHLSFRLVLPLALAALAGVAGCRRPIASPEECDAVANHLAELQVRKEKIPPFGRLASKGFDGPDEVKAIFEEAKKSARDRCAKGWKRAVYECMMEAQDLAVADRCRFL